VDVPEITNDPAYKTHLNIRSQRWYLLGGGCARRCGFCLWHDSTHRNRDLSVLEKEFEWLEGGVEFCHPNLFWKRSWLEEYLQRVRRFPCKSMLKTAAHITDVHKNMDLLPACRDFGLHTISIGIESASRRVLNSINKTDNDLLKLKEVGKVMNDLGLELYVNLIIGLPEDGHDSLQETFGMMGEMGFNTSSCSMLMPYPGTPVYQDIINNNLCSREELSLTSYMDFLADRAKGSVVAMVKTKHLDKQELGKWFAKFRSHLHGNPMDI